MRRPLSRASCAIVGALAYIPILTQQPTAGLDASWAAALQYGAQAGWQFGRDVTFTYGPLGYLAVPFFAPDFYWWTVGVRMAMGLVCGWAFHAIGTRAGWPEWMPPVVLLSILPPTMASFDVPWTLPLVLWPVLALREGRRVSAVAICLSAVVGLLALVKFTLTMLAAGLAVLLLVGDVAHRRRPVTAGVFVASALLLWLLTGQRLAHLPAWLATSWEMSSAYSEAMSTPVGPYQVRELLLFGTDVLTLLGAAVWLRDDDRRAAWQFLPLGALLLVLFVQFKLGFVRHDAHATAAMFAMPLLGVLVGAPGLAPDARRLSRLIALVAIAIGLATYAYGLRRYFDRLAVPEHYRAYYAVQWRAVGGMLHPLRLHAELSAHHEAALARLRRDVPLPPLDGSVDVQGHRQGYVLAHQVTYVPRPVFQSYGAYTTRLAALNRRHVDAGDGPRHVLVDVETPDARYPLIDDGATLPVLLSDFDVRQTVPPFVHLERRGTPRRLAFVPWRETSLRQGERLAIGDTGEMVWGRLRLQRTLLGRLLAAAYKLPPVIVHVSLADGTSRQHRLLREPAGAGMLVSPLVTTPDDFARLHAGAPAPAAHRVVALQVDVDWEAAYDSRVEVSLARLRVW